MAAKKRQGQASSAKRWSRGFRRASKCLSATDRRVFQKAGFVETEMVSRWNEIVGEEFARYTLPCRIWFPRGKRSEGKLEIIAESSFATEVQHLEPILLDRLNTYFGYGALISLQIRQGPVRRRLQSGRVETPPLGMKQAAALETLISETRSDVVRDALRRLGKEVFAEKT